MDVFDALSGRRSIRDFVPDGLPEEDLRRMLEAAQHAPSSGNGQPWRFLVLRDPGRKQDLVAATISHAARDLERRGHPPEVVANWRDSAAGLAARLLDAPVWVLLFVDNRRYPGLAAQDGALAAQNLMLAAHALGYGTSYQTTLFPEAAVLAHFNIPDRYSFLCTLPVGRPRATPSVSGRRPLSTVVWEGGFSPEGVGGGTHQPKPLVEIVYSPACPVNAHFVAAARAWLEPFLASGRIDVAEVRTDLSPSRTARLLGLEDLAQLKHNVFIKVFVDGREVSSVPLHPADVCNGVCSALGLAGTADRGPAAWWGPGEHEDRSSRLQSLRYEVLTRDNLAGSLELCLCRHPAGGLTPLPYHEPGRRMKLEWVEQAWPEAPALGIVALDGDSPAGLVEAYPRRMAREAGFVTGRESPDEETLTVTCIEVAGGYPRLEVIDALMAKLVEAYAGGLGRYRWLEGLGVYGQMAGTNPYWVFEKYGFSRVQELVPGKRALLRKRL